MSGQDGRELRAEVDRVGGEVERVPVEPAEQRQTIYATVTGWRVAERRPIIPAWMRSRDDRRAFAAWLAAHGAHVAGFHASRSLLYLARLAWRAPVGRLPGGWVAGRVAVRPGGSAATGGHHPVG